MNVLTKWLVTPKTFTYVNESLNCASSIDYFLTSVADRIINFFVHDVGSNLSDHFPIVINCTCTTTEATPISSGATSSEPIQTFLRWDHADTNQYYHLTGHYLQVLLTAFNEFEIEFGLLNVDFDVIMSKINFFYDQIVNILRDCAAITVPAHSKQFYKFWWNQELDCLKEKAIEDHKLWKSVGKPRGGPISDKYRASKLTYKMRIRESKQKQDSMYTNELHEALTAKQGPAFWKCWRSKFMPRNKRVSQINGLVDDAEIAQKFELFFKQACTHLSDDGNQNLQAIYGNMRKDYCGMPYTDDLDFDVGLIEAIIDRMKRGKAAGLDELTVEHLQCSHPALFLFLTKLFNLCMKCGRVPDDFGRSYTIPLLKDDRNSASKTLTVEDFRGISISPVISKVFENCILNRYKSFFVTSDNQFGFKKGLSCSHAIFSVKCVVNHYSNLGSTINLCFLDLKKAFDKMNHYGLYIKLMTRLIPNVLLCVLEFWFSMSKTCVRWGNAMSNFITLECGVRQGGILSPYLFAIFIDDIIAKIEMSNLGCRYKHRPVSIIIYADDIILLSPSIEALQNMLHLCEIELAWLDMALSAKKSSCMRIGPRYDAQCADLTTLNGERLLWVKSSRYLGIHIVASKLFKCCFSDSRKAFYRAVNSILGKIGRSASEEVVLHLVETKCLPILLYGLDVCPLNVADTKSFDFVLTRVLMKLFKTSSIDVINECYTMFNVKRVSQSIHKRKLAFLSKFADGNGLCMHFSKAAHNDLRLLGL